MRRWVSLAAAIIIQSCLGMIYAWSTFSPALQQHGVSAGACGMIFGLCIISFTLAMPFGGMLLKSRGPRLPGVAGGLLFMSGYSYGAASDGCTWMLFAGVGVIAGIGIGMAYLCPLAVAISCFPEHKGLVTGLTVAGFGLGGVIFASAGQHMLNAGIPVFSVLSHIGLTVGIIVVCASIFLHIPEAHRYKNPVGVPRVSLGQHLRRPDFHLLFLQMFLATSGGLLIIGNLKLLAISRHLPAASATFSIMLFSIGNALGRILWGACYDRFGASCLTVSMLLSVCGALSMALLPGIAAFHVAAAVIAFAFGGCFVLFVALIADRFGVHRISDMYPLVFIGYGLAGLIAPTVGGWMIGQLSSALYPCLAAALLSLAAALVSMYRNLSLKTPCTLKAEQYE